MKKFSHVGCFVIPISLLIFSGCQSNYGKKDNGGGIFQKIVFQPQ